MDISGIGNLVSSVAAASSNQDVSIAVLKAALNSEAQTASTLIQAIPAPPNLSSNLGQNINTTA